MENKRLRKSKNVSAADMEKLSLAAKRQLSDAVNRQFAETIKLPAEYEDISNEINEKGLEILKTGYVVNEYCSVLSGTYEIKSAAEDICDIVSYVCCRAEAYTEKYGIRITRKIPGSRIFVKIDEERFVYAFLNILLNAFENSFEGTKIKVSVLKTSKFAKVTVEDEGIGMDEETLSHCCEPLFSAKRRNGLGLGLCMARHFAFENGGRLKILSVLGKGTEVSLFIPLAAEEDYLLGTKNPVSEIFGQKPSPVDIMFSGATCAKPDEKL